MVKPPMISEAEIRARLEEEKAKIIDMRESSQEARAIVELDQNKQGRLSRMDALERQAIAQNTDRRRSLRLAQIDAALTRMEEGEFGYCQDCGDKISSKRLNAEPCVLRCRSCAAC